MKKHSLYMILLLSLMIMGISCEDYTTSIDPLIDRVEDERLTAESQINFVINGVHTRFATTYCRTCVLVGLLSDEMYFDPNVPNATFPSFADIDVGEIILDNNSVDGVFNGIGELRFFSDDLIRRIGEITFSDQTLQDKGLFWSNFYGGVARYLYATYFGLNENEGGGIIDNGPFIPSADMYDLAVEKFNTALENTDDTYQVRMVHSCLARLYLFQSDYANAATHANQGMENGDDPFQSLHSVQSDNYFWQQAGVGRTQCVVPQRFKDYTIADPNELTRVKLDSIFGNNEVWFYRQGKYLIEASPINFVSWQENELMLAECALQGQATAGDALTRINAVRNYHGLDPLNTADMTVLMEERDKELCWIGVRLPDQRRWDAQYQTWHLGADKWHYLPITERERNINPNLPDV